MSQPNAEDIIQSKCINPQSNFPLQQITTSLVILRLKLELIRVFSFIRESKMTKSRYSFSCVVLFFYIFLALNEKNPHPTFRTKTTCTNLMYIKPLILIYFFCFTFEPSSCVNIITSCCYIQPVLISVSKHLNKYHTILFDNFMMNSRGT